MKSSAKPLSSERPRDLGDAFQAYLGRRRKLAGRTISAYTYNGAGMIRFFQSHGARTIDDVTMELAEAWVSWLLKEGRADGAAA